MDNGYGSVFVRVFNATGSVVFDTVTRLTYKHSDKADDYSTIVIESGDISIMDSPDLQEHKALILVWGYLNGKTRTHKVYIWDIKPTFGALGLRLEIVAYCKAAYLKLTSSKDVYNGQGMDDIAQEIAQAYGLEYQEEGLLQPASETNDPVVPKIETDVTGIKTESVLNLKTNLITQARDNTAYVKYNFKKYDGGVPQAGASDKKLLDKLAEDEPTYNLVVDGHDDLLIIRRRDLYQKAYKSYTYKSEPGFLLEFTPATKNSNNQKGISNTVQGWIDEDKEFVEGEVNSSHSGAGALGDMVEMSTEEIIRRKLYKESSNPVGQNTTINGFFNETYEGQDENGNPIYKRVLVEKLDSTKTSWAHITKRGTRASQLDLQRNSITAAIDNTGRVELNGFIPVTAKEVVQTIEDNKEDIAGAGVNRQSKAQLELTEASAEILGDPDLESAKVITILNVSKRYSGNYYISCVTHEVVPESGYLCYLDLMRNALTKTGDEGPNKIDVRTLGIDTNLSPGIPNDGTRELLTINPIKD